MDRLTCTALVGVSVNVRKPGKMRRHRKRHHG